MDGKYMVKMQKSIFQKIFRWSFLMNNPQKNPNMEKINLAYQAAFNSSNWKELQQNILSAVVDPRAVSTRLILIPSNFSPVFPPVSEGIGPKSESFDILIKK